jgi:predicted acylesterase/phospholipase RssA
MEAVIAYIWDLRTVATFFVGMSSGLVIAGLLAAARLNDEPAVEDYDLSNYEDRVDIRDFLRRHHHD